MPAGAPPERGRVFHRVSSTFPVVLLLSLCLLAPACASGPSRYQLVEQNLLAGRPLQADAVLQQAEEDYGSKNLVLYGMDRGVVLQLAGRYQDSNVLLTQAEDEIERLYTRKIRNEALSFLLNDNELPFEGDPHEQVMINVVKAVNYALMEDWSGALVEARRIDHRLNVISDRETGKDAYRDDGFARYLTGILYEIGGDLNNAFVAYRRAYDGYQSNRGWSRTPVPPSLKSDLLRAADRLHLTEEVEDYRREFPETAWEPVSSRAHLAQIILISYNGRAPIRVDQFLDIPLSLDAARLVLLARGYGGGSQRTRTADSLLYGLNGRVVRVAIPRLIPQRNQVAGGQLSLIGDSGVFTARTEMVHDLTAMAEKSLSDQLPGIMVRAAARAAVKYGLAEGIEQGVRSATRQRNRNGDRADLEWVAFVVGSLLKTMAIATEEADKRCWQTLPAQIHVARLWVPAGEYDLRTRSLAQQGGLVRPETATRVTLRAGDTRFVVERVLQ
ncbi:MAG: COG3014 family protein [Nitrospiraceae bacterium]